jgi:hypothetical protein
MDGGAGRVKSSLRKWMREKRTQEIEERRDSHPNVLKVYEGR